MGVPFCAQPQVRAQPPKFARPGRGSAISTEAAAPRSPQQKNLTIALAVLGVFVAYFPINGVSGALHTIGVATGADTSQLQWVSTAYVIPLAAAVLSAGVIGDLHGRRKLFLLGAGLISLGSGIAAVASVFNGGSIAVLVAGQAVAGLGAGVMLPTTLSLISFASPDPVTRGRYIAMWATGTGAGLAVGPLVSGLLLQVTGWGWIFLPPLLLAVVAAIIAYTRLPESTSPAGRALDVPGQIAASIAIVALSFGVIEGGAQGWSSGLAVGGLTVGVLALLSFLVIEHRTRTPLMSLSLFKIPSFSAANFGVVMALLAVVGVVFVIAIYLGATQRLSALEIAVRIVFIPGVSALVNPVVGRLSGRIPAQHLLSAGLLLGAVGTLLISRVDADTSYPDLVWRLALFGVANAMMLTAAPISAINAVPPVYGGMAGATNTALRQLGAALGPAVLGTIYAMGTAAGGGVATTGLKAAMLSTTVLLTVSGLACLLAFFLSRKPTPRV